MVETGEEIAVAPIVGRCQGGWLCRLAWIVTKRGRRKPALRAILHGEVGRKGPREWHDRLAVGLEAVGLEAVGLIPLQWQHLTPARLARNSQPATNNCVSLSNSFLPRRIRSASSPEYRDRPGRNTGFSGVRASSEVFPEDLPAGGPGPGCLPLGCPGQAIPRFCRICGGKFHRSWCRGDCLRHGGTSTVT